MTVKLLTDLDKELPKTVEFNYDELKESLESILENFKGKEETTSSNYRKRKEDRAQLNKLSAAIDGVRKEVKKKLLDVINNGTNDNPSFVEKMNALVSLIESVSMEIDKGIKEYEEKIREESAMQITDMLEKTAVKTLGEKWKGKANSWLKEWSSAQMTRKKNAWLNIGADMNCVFAEISTELVRCKNAIEKLKSILKESDSEMTRVLAENELSKKFDIADAIIAIEQSRENERVAFERKERERIEQLKRMSKEVVPVETENGKEKSEENKQCMFSCEMRFVGTLDAFQNLKDYLSMNKDITFTVIRQMEEINNK